DLEAKVVAHQRDDMSIHIASNLGTGTFDGEVFKASSEEDDLRRTLEPIKISTEAVLRHFNLRRGVELHVESEIPASVGLGSSAATSVATVAAVSRLLGFELTSSDILSMSLDAEKYVHGSPSGIDQQVSTLGGILLYRRSGEPMRLKCPVELPLVIGNTCERRSTGMLVEAVKQRRNRLPTVMDHLIKTAGCLVREGADALQSGDLDRLGELMDINHGLLASVGVSTMALDRLVYAARSAGALGAKLTGAGGGGCIVALCRHGQQLKVAEGIKLAGGKPLIVKKRERGVETWLR
ncbi:MAG: mevalonate kinase, partial [Candidatus Bathyarchaeia archaeon]